MLINALAAIIKKIQLNIETEITSINDKTTEIGLFDTSHLKYGTTTPIFPKLEFFTTSFDLGTFSTSYLFDYSFPADDEILVFASSGSAISLRRLDLELTASSIETITNFPSHNMEDISGTYYAFGGGYYTTYNSDFSSVSTNALAENASPDQTKNTFEDSKLVSYFGYEKKIFLTDGSLSSSTYIVPKEQIYQRDMVIAKQCYANRFIKMLHYDSEVYILDSWLMQDAIYRPIGDYIYFLKAFRPRFGSTVHVFLGRFETL